MCIKRGKKKERTAGKSVGSVRQVTQTLSREWMVRSTDERATVLLTGYRRETGRVLLCENLIVPIHDHQLDLLP